MADAIPQATANAVVVGDPRLDRMRASGGLRARYRRSLGLADHTELVVVSSTWWSRSLFGTWPDLLRQLIAELPVDRFRVAAILHPHVWHGHGPMQVRLWLSDCMRAGLLLVPPAEGWSATLIAADLVVGDHGAVTCYAAAMDKPVLLAAFPHDDVAAGSCVDLLGDLAPALDRDKPLLDQVERTVRGYVSGRYRDVADLVTSAPNEAATRLRKLCYDLMDLTVPTGSAAIPLLPNPSVSARTTHTPHDAVRASGTVTGPGDVTLRRHAADVLSDRRSMHPVLDDAHLVAHAEHPFPAVRSNADIVFLRGDDLGPSPQTCLSEALATNPFCLMAAVVLDRERCLLAVRGGPTALLARRAEDSFVEPLAAVSAFYLWWSHQTDDHPSLPRALRVDLGCGIGAVFDVDSDV